MPTESRPMAILQRSSTLVQLLAERGPLSTAQVAELVGIPRPSVYRLSDSLVKARLVEFTADGKLGVSLRWLKLADAARDGMTEWSGARVVLDDLARSTGQTVYLSVPHGDRAMCIDWVQGRGISVMVLKPGRTLPLHAGAAGRVTLAFRPEPIQEYLRGAPFSAFTDRTLTSASELRADVKATRRRGFSVSDEDVTPGIGAIGVPLHGVDKVFTGALSLGGLAGDLRDRRDGLVTELFAAAVQLSATT
jgi:IclR family transcriptional regulator, acetate operon repressor